VAAINHRMDDIADQRIGHRNKTAIALSRKGARGFRSFVLAIRHDTQFVVPDCRLARRDGVQRCFWLVVPMFLIVLPLLFLLPKEGVPSGTVEPAEAH
jgi:hypothetical protein